MEKIRTLLRCSHCFKDSSTKIVYSKNSAVKIICENCGYTVRIPQSSKPEFSIVDWEQRLLTKPLRIALEIKKDSFHFISTFPLRLVTKPLRIARELEKSLT
ncbi:hypothetical protein DRJ04_04045 [Candidatus Aerophobetes bacterium]|uniref:Bh protein n=1 Tax=Aerophobetes bacterium TaxID=2030807 RepID=A0A662DCV6_UNCAE|nr:MAG: hypothetical protein DRJ04_04045 [Candidatus Aerophobetes bacterium]